MERPETIRTSLQVGEWVISIDFKEAFFHIPTENQSKKYPRFHVQGQTYQFKALSFGLSTAPMEFTVVAKKVKLITVQKGIRIHQYDWLIRARSDWLIRARSQQVFDFVGYQFDLKERNVRPILEHWQILTTKIQELLAGLT